MRQVTLCTILMIGLGLIRLQAQEATLSIGGGASGSGGSASYSIGQMVYTINTGTGGSIAQGIQIPFEISIVTGLEETHGIDLIFSAFPNPTTNYLTLSVDKSYTPYQELSYRLYDINGRLLKNERIEGNETRIDMYHLVPAIYFLKVFDNQSNDRSNMAVAKQFNAIKTFKIIKK